jgi:hypothetical protein
LPQEGRSQIRPFLIRLDFPIEAKMQHPGIVRNHIAGISMGGCAGDPQVVNHHESCCGGYGCSSSDAYSMNITKMNRHGLACAPRNALALINKTNPGESCESCRLARTAPLLCDDEQAESFGIKSSEGLVSGALDLGSFHL